MSTPPFPNQPVGNAGRRLPATLRLLRPQQWLKNGFVFLPIFFGKGAGNADILLHGLLAFAAFCLAAGAIYATNDVIDAEADRAHPKKRHRPVAAGLLSRRQASGIATLCLAGALGLAWAATPHLPGERGMGVLPIVVVYLVTNVLYSVLLKSVMLVDVFVIAFGFILRVLAGAEVMAVRPSDWLLLLTFFLALFLATGKRRGELAALADGGAAHRAVLGSYSLVVLDHMLQVLIGMIIVMYSLFCLSPHVSTTFGEHRMVVTIPLVVFGLFQYLVRIHAGGFGGDPTELLLSDRGLGVTVLLWGLLCGGIVYF